MSLILVIRNVSSLADISDYEYKVLVGDGGPLSNVLASGTIKGHPRQDGWQKLVTRLLDQEPK